MKRTMAAVLVAAAVFSGCGGRPAQEGGGDPTQVEAASLREPMMEAVSHLEELIREANRGDLKAVRVAYTAFGAAFGRVLPPLSFKDGELARRVANAHTGLRELLGQPQVETGALLRQAGHLRAALQDAAVAMDVPLIVPAASQERVQRVTVTAKEYEFRPTLIDVKLGDRVTVQLVNQGTVAHEWSLAALGARIPPVPPGGSGEVTFVASKPGTHEYVCNIGDHKERGMRGFLRVSE